jgi:DNA-binding transcriptional ArsR family regulator
MLKFLQDRKVGKGKKEYLSELSKIARDEREKILREKIREIVLEELKNSGIIERLDDISKFTKSVDKKMEDMKSSIAPLSRSKTDSIRKLKMKRVVIELLNKHKRMNASDMSVRLNLSRTRCSEYLTELEKAGVTKGVILSRQKFYELNDEAPKGQDV